VSRSGDNLRMSHIEAGKVGARVAGFLTYAAQYAKRAREPDIVNLRERRDKVVRRFSSALVPGISGT